MLAASLSRAQDLTAPFPSSALVLEVLEFIRLLCEGHNTHVQDFLRDQEEFHTKHDLVVEVYEYVFALEKELERTNLLFMLKALDTLTELVQGNHSAGNAKVLIETKLVRILGRLVSTRLIDNKQELGDLHLSALTLLNALLEGASQVGHPRSEPDVNPHARNTPSPSCLW